MRHYDDLPPRSKSFDTLYHGTIIENTASICKEGLKRGTPDRIGYVSREDPMGLDRTDDCVGIVNLSKNKKSAIFFACGWRQTAKGEPGQAIFEIDASKLDRSKMFFRNMFGKPWAEVKYLDNIPPEAIKQVFIRKFDWTDDDLNVTEKYMGCNEILEKGTDFWKEI
jgi:hypothetical protein